QRAAPQPPRSQLLPTWRQLSSYDHQSNHEATKPRRNTKKTFVVQTISSSCVFVFFVSSCLHYCHAVTGLRVRPRSFSTSAGRTLTTRSTSASVENNPRLKRSEFCVRCAGSPIARSTCDGSSV